MTAKPGRTRREGRRFGGVRIKPGQMERQGEINKIVDRLRELGVKVEFKDGKAIVHN